MQRLLYHAPDNPNQDSPFDRAIVQVVQGQNVSIVSPYIGLGTCLEPQRVVSLGQDPEAAFSGRGAPICPHATEPCDAHQAPGPLRLCAENLGE